MTKIAAGAFLFIFVILVVFVIHGVFTGSIILPQSFHVGPLTLRYYGLFLGLATVAGYFLARQRFARYGLSETQADEIIFYSIIGSFLGARLYHVLSQWDLYSQHPWDALKIWNGGLSIYGVILGGMLTVWLSKKFLKIPVAVLSLYDWLAPSVLLGQVIGRLGNFFNYELYGYPTTLPWKMFVPWQFRPAQLSEQAYFHPLFLYEAVGNLIILMCLLRFSSRLRERPGALFFWSLLLYNVLRFTLEFIRVDSVFWGNVRINAVVSALLAMAAAAGILFWARKNHA